jgi:hypothetical protein
MAAPTRDHIRPRSKGGTLAPGNKARACDRCNTNKGRPLACFVAVQAREGWRSAGGYRRAIVGIDYAGAVQIGQMLTSAFANRLLAAAEEAPTAQ